MRVHTPTNGWTRAKTNNNSSQLTNGRTVAAPTAAAAVRIVTVLLYIYF